MVMIDGWCTATQIQDPKGVIAKLVTQPSNTKSPKAILNEMGINPRKPLGQHFLVASGVINIITKAAQIQLTDTILEVGPGLGILTKELVKQSPNVIAIELDEHLANALSDRIQSKGLKVITEDARNVDIKEVTGGLPYKLISNLPYYAAGPILRHFLESDHPPETAVIMVQREVAKQMVAKPGHMSLVSIGTQIYGDTRIVSFIPSSAFYPKPKVTSAIVKIDTYENPLVEHANRKSFFSVVKAGFSAPRKQLRNSLAQGLKVPTAIAVYQLTSAGINPEARPATLTLEDWRALHLIIHEGATESESPISND